MSAFAARGDGGGDKKKKSRRASTNSNVRRRRTKISSRFFTTVADSIGTFASNIVSGMDMRKRSHTTESLEGEQSGADGRATKSGRRQQSDNGADNPKIFASDVRKPGRFSRTLSVSHINDRSETRSGEYTLHSPKEINANRSDHLRCRVCETLIPEAALEAHTPICVEHQKTLRVVKDVDVAMAKLRAHYLAKYAKAWPKDILQEVNRVVDNATEVAPDDPTATHVLGECSRLVKGLVKRCSDNYRLVGVLHKLSAYISRKHVSTRTIVVKAFELDSIAMLPLSPALTKGRKMILGPGAKINSGSKFGNGRNEGATDAAGRGSNDERTEFNVPFFPCLDNDECLDALVPKSLRGGGGGDIRYRRAISFHYDPKVEANNIHKINKKGLDAVSRNLLDGSRRKISPKKVTIHDFNIIKPISKGAFGRVYLVSKKNTGDLYAAKVLSKAEMKHKNETKRVRKERNIMTNLKLNNPFVVKLIYSFQTSKNLFLLMEYQPGGDLHSLLVNLGALEEDIVRIYVGEIVLALKSLHASGCVHRDLKPDNILIGRGGHIKLTDFGLSEDGVQRRTNRHRRSRSSTLRVSTLERSRLAYESSILHNGSTSGSSILERELEQSNSGSEGKALAESGATKWKKRNGTRVSELQPIKVSDSKGFLESASKVLGNSLRGGLTLFDRLLPQKFSTENERASWDEQGSSFSAGSGKSVTPRLSAISEEGGRENIATVSSRVSVDSLKLSRDSLSFELDPEDPSLLLPSSVKLVRDSSNKNLPDLLIMRRESSVNGLTALGARGSSYEDLAADKMEDDSGTKGSTGENDCRGTPDYLAPELLLGKSHTFSVDYWALGVIVYELLCGVPPFNAETVEEIFTNIKTRNFRWPGEEYISQPAHDLIDKLLQVNPKVRYGAKEIMSHRVFEGVDFDGLYKSDPPFIPVLENAFDTSYFDNRELEDLKELLQDEDSGSAIVHEEGAEDGAGDGVSGNVSSVLTPEDASKLRAESPRAGSPPPGKSATTDNLDELKKGSDNMLNALHKMHSGENNVLEFIESMDALGSTGDRADSPVQKRNGSPTPKDLNLANVAKDYLHLTPTTTKKKGLGKSRDRPMGPSSLVYMKSDGSDTSDGSGTGLTRAVRAFSFENLDELAQQNLKLVEEREKEKNNEN